jgi:threonine dehydrogenase-like Zn-dependent dehydrogenase
MPIRAAVLPAPRRPLEIWQLDDPHLEEGSVLLETVASEVCGTDVHLRDGRLAGVPYPLLMGHVSVGRILESRGVERDAMGAPLARGDVVTFLDVHEVCGKCYHCAVTAQPNRCPSRRVYGITYGALEGPLGGWAERIYLKPGVRIVKLPEALSADDVIGGGCGLFTGFAAVERSALAMGDTVLVQGAGPVGLSVGGFASLRGAGRVLMVGAPQARLALGRLFGVDETFDLVATTVQERSTRVRELTAGRGADVVIEASGNPAAIPEGLGLVREGGTYIVAGHYTDAGETRVNPHTDINRKHLDLRGQWGTEFRHIARALTVFARHRERLPFQRVIGGRYGLEEADRALKDVEDLRVTKAIMDPKLR